MNKISGRETAAPASAACDPPQRIQLRRSKGWRMPANTVKVDRTKKWGNPFKVGQRNPCGTITKDQRHAWQLYLGFAPTNDKLVEAARAELRGKNLACWCAKDNPYEDICHAAVLLKIANAPASLEEGRNQRPETSRSHAP